MILTFCLPFFLLELLAFSALPASIAGVAGVAAGLGPAKTSIPGGTREEGSSTAFCRMP